MQRKLPETPFFKPFLQVVVQFCGLHNYYDIWELVLLVWIKNSIWTVLNHRCIDSHKYFVIWIITSLLSLTTEWTRTILEFHGHRAEWKFYQYSVLSTYTVRHGQIYFNYGFMYKESININCVCQILYFFTSVYWTLIFAIYCNDKNLIIDNFTICNPTI